MASKDIAALDHASQPSHTTSTSRGHETVAAPSAANVGAHTSTPPLAVRRSVDILALQRLHGNRMVGGLLTGAAHPIAHPLKSSFATTIQRLPNLREIYSHVFNHGNEADKRMLKDFIRIQEILDDTETVKTYLKQLSRNFDYWGYVWRDLDKELKKYEADYAASRPILIGSAGGAFTRVVNRRQMFTDLVANQHGVFTHRLQWFIIGQDIQANREAWNNPVYTLYQAASLGKWRVSEEGRYQGKYMWELVVDQFKSAGNFTSPDILEKYILENRSEFPNLTLEVLKSSNSQQTDKEHYRNEYKKSERYQNQETTPDMNIIRDDEVRVGTLLFTGFLKSGWGEPAPLDRMYLPTVVYLNGETPDARGRS